MNWEGEGERRGHQIMKELGNRQVPISSAMELQLDSISLFENRIVSLLFLLLLLSEWLPKLKLSFKVASRIFIRSFRKPVTSISFSNLPPRQKSGSTLPLLLLVPMTQQAISLLRTKHFKFILHDSELMSKIIHCLAAVECNAKLSHHRNNCSLMTFYNKKKS